MMIVRPTLWVLAALICLTILVGRSLADGDFTSLEARVEVFCDQMVAPGLSISVGIEDRLVWSKGCGMADLEQQVAVDPATTRFRVGSVAKPFTAFALARLLEEERIDLDADVRQYVPLFPAKEHGFTLRQLAGHLAGIRHYQEGEAYLHRHFETVSDGLSIFADDPLIHAPGEAWRYSSYGFNLLSAAIEQAAGVPFTDYLHEQVFKPLGMHNTMPDRLEQIIPGRGRYYYLDNGVLRNEREVDNSYKWAAGGFVSTTDDMVRFGLAHLNPEFLQSETIERLWTPQSTSNGESTGYGLGWRIVQDDKDRFWIGHGGGSIGGTSQFWIFPEERMVVAAASNLTELDFGVLLVDIRDLLTDDD